MTYESMAIIHGKCVFVMLLTLSVPTAAAEAAAAGGGDPAATAAADPSLLAAPISAWNALGSAVVAAAGKTATIALSPSFTMAGFAPDYKSIDIASDGTVLTIDGHGATLDAGGKGRFFAVGNTVVVSMRNITMKNGYSGKDGGGGALNIYGGIVTLDHCAFVNNKAPYDGGAVSVYIGIVTLERCTFVNNTAFSGGAVWFNFGTTGLIKGSSFSGPISNNHNDISRYDTDANVTFACADGEVGIPVQMQGTEITVIPPLELQCK
jgi:hypothetical protein